VIPTTIGATRASRRWASTTKCSARRRSIGAVIRQAASTRSGTASAATTASSDARPVTTPIITTAISRTAHTPARVRRRRVQANGEVRPFNDRPNGPAATTAAVRIPASGFHTEMTPPATAAAAIAS